MEKAKMPLKTKGILFLILGLITVFIQFINPPEAWTILPILKVVLGLTLSAFGVFYITGKGK